MSRSSLAWREFSVILLVDALDSLDSPIFSYVQRAMSSKGKRTRLCHS